MRVIFRIFLILNLVIISYMIYRFFNKEISIYVFIFNCSIAVIASVAFSTALAIKQVSRYETIFYSRKSYDEIIDSIIKYCSLQKKWKYTIRSPHHIAIRTGVSLLSFGEEISIEIGSGHEHETPIKLSSESQIKTTKVDYNVNQNNVEGLKVVLS